ncbi:MAG: methionine biosynthesis protein MetW [Planctomycetaceae bacterium]|nr:methionine biosynthesis protein MetW [Planctomycetaceae bacterium]
MQESHFAGGVEKGELSALLRLIGRKVDPALLEFLLHQGRNFLGGVGTSEERPEGNADWQYELIADLVPEGASVLDLGCGEGNLLARLTREKNARVQGVELDAGNVEVCVEKGVPVIQADLDLGLSVFPDASFDYVILEETLQTLRRPDTIIAEMRRVGGRGIVTFPNFGFWKVRLDLAVRGRMPVTGWLPHRWYQTPNIHLFTIRDFLDYADEIGMNIIDIHVLKNGVSSRFEENDNLYAEEALVFFE